MFSTLEKQYCFVIVILQVFPLLFALFTVKLQPFPQRMYQLTRFTVKLQAFPQRMYQLTRFTVKLQPFPRRMYQLTRFTVKLQPFPQRMYQLTRLSLIMDIVFGICYHRGERCHQW